MMSWRDIVGESETCLSAWRIEAACVCDSCGVVTAQLGVRAEWGAASRRSVGIAKHYGYKDDSGK